MIYLEDSVWQRVQKLAERKCMSVHKLCSLYIEMAVTWEEIQAHNTACSLIEEVLAKAFGESLDDLEEKEVRRDV